jgi:hypothetical protein
MSRWLQALQSNFDGAYWTVSFFFFLFSFSFLLLCHLLYFMSSPCSLFVYRLFLVSQKSRRDKGPRSDFPSKKEEEKGEEILGVAAESSSHESGK